MLTMRCFDSFPCRDDAGTEYWCLILEWLDASLFDVVRANGTCWEKCRPGSALGAFSVEMALGESARGRLSWRPLRGDRPEARREGRCEVRTEVDIQGSELEARTGELFPGAPWDALARPLSSVSRCRLRALVILCPSSSGRSMRRCRTHSTKRSRRVATTWNCVSLSNMRTLRALPFVGGPTTKSPVDATLRTSGREGRRRLVARFYMSTPCGGCKSLPMPPRSGR